MESVIRVERKPRELRACIIQRVRDRGQSLTVAPDGQAQKLGFRKLQLVPLERDLQIHIVRYTSLVASVSRDAHARLCRIAHAQFRRFRFLGAKLGENVIL